MIDTPTHATAPIRLEYSGQPLPGHVIVRWEPAKITIELLPNKSAILLHAIYIFIFVSIAMVAGILYHRQDPTAPYRPVLILLGLIWTVGVWPSIRGIIHISRPSTIELTQEFLTYTCTVKSVVRRYTASTPTIADVRCQRGKFLSDPRILPGVVLAFSNGQAMCLSVQRWHIAPVLRILRESLGMPALDDTARQEPSRSPGWRIVAHHNATGVQLMARPHWPILASMATVPFLLAAAWETIDFINGPGARASLVSTSSWFAALGTCTLAFLILLMPWRAFRSIARSVSIWIRSGNMGIREMGFFHPSLLEWPLASVASIASIPSPNPKRGCLRIALRNGETFDVLLGWPIREIKWAGEQLATPLRTIPTAKIATPAKAHNDVSSFQDHPES